MAPPGVFLPADPTPALRGRTPAVDQFYVSGEDHLHVTAYSRLGAGIRIMVTWRFWSARRGIVQVNADEVVTVAYPFPAAKLILLDEGVLLNVRVSPVSVSGLLYGGVYARVQIVRGSTGAIFGLATILQGYLTTENERAWPGSPLQGMHEGPGAIRAEAFTQLTGPITATLIVPDVVRWRVVSGHLHFVASAAAGNRNLFLQILDPGGNILFRALANQTRAANQQLQLGFGGAAAAPPNTFDGWEVLGFPVDVDLRDSAEVAVVVINEQAGDALTGQRALVREWMAI